MLQEKICLKVEFVELRSKFSYVQDKFSYGSSPIMVFHLYIYTFCKPSSWDKKSCKSPTFVTSPDIVKICWPVPVVFSFFLGRVFRVKISCPLWLIYCSSSFILPIVSNKWYQSLV